MNPGQLEILATALFALAIVHTFSVKRFHHWAHHFRDGSIGDSTMRLLAEVEIVFGLWAGVFISGMAILAGTHATVEFMEGHFVPAGAEHAVHINFTEPAFVFVIMTVAATRPVLQLAQGAIEAISRLLPVSRTVAFFATAMVVGPLLGSFITEPAAMTVTALILLRRIYLRDGVSSRLKYATIGLLFVNISIGGTLTNFAAPPVLMVAGPDRFDWDLMFMLTHFGYKAAVAVMINAVAVTLLFRRQLAALDDAPRPAASSSDAPVPWGLVLVHVLFLAGIVYFSHHMVMFLGLFLFFLGLVVATQEYQDELKLREGLLVGFFLGGLVILGGLQRWWLQPILESLGELPLFLGAAGLTAFTDNAALTYLGSQVPGLSDGMKYALVAGAVAGGGLTVIANAPNPAGFGILREGFGDEGISPLSLLAGAIGPTLVAMACLWLLPSL